MSGLDVLLFLILGFMCLGSKLKLILGNNMVLVIDMGIVLMYGVWCSIMLWRWFVMIRFCGIMILGWWEIFCIYDSGFKEFVKRVCVL